MIKKQNVSNSLLKSISFGIIAVYIVDTIALLSGLPHVLPAKWMSVPLFTLDYPLAFLMPIVAFILGYVATANKNTWARVFDGSLFLAGYWWLHTLVTGIILYTIDASSSSTASIVTILVQNILPIIVLGLYTCIARRKTSTEPAGIRQPFMLSFATIAIATIVFQIISLISALAQNTIPFHEFTLNANATSLAPFLFVVLVMLGYSHLRAVKQPLTQLFFAIIAATLYVFAASAILGIFGTMPAQTWLIITGNIVSLAATLLVLYLIALHLTSAKKK